MLRENIKLNTIKLSINRASHMRKMRHLRFVCLIKKLSVKIVFHIFQFLVVHTKKKNYLMENYLWLTKNSNKNKTYFL